jgi:catechol-2,3-dioxygenase
MPSSLNRRSAMGVLAFAPFLFSRTALGQQPITLAQVQASLVGYVNFVFRTQDAAALAEWYCGVLRLPLIRGATHTFFLWTGDIQVMELLSDQSAVPPDRITDPTRAPTVPIFRVRDADAVLKRLTARGVKLASSERSRFGKTHFILDPENNLIGLRERSRASSFAFDQLAQRKWTMGETFNPGASMMPPDIQQVGWVRRNVHDLKVGAHFFERIIGLNRLGEEDGRVLFDMGNNVVLELGGSGLNVLPPASRRTVPAVFVLRVEDHDLVNAWLKQNPGLRYVDDALRFNSAELTYLTDPSGHLVGIDERFEPHEFKTPRRVFLEDVEIERRWKAELAARAKAR